MHRIVGLSFLSLVASIGCAPPASVDEQSAQKTWQEPETQTPPPAPRVAEVGVGIKGKSLENETGVSQMIAAPAVALFKTKEKVAFEIQIPRAMQLYEALEGRKPRSHESSCRNYRVQQNQLAQLPDGQVYKYHRTMASYGSNQFNSWNLVVTVICEYWIY